MVFEPLCGGDELVNKAAENLNAKWLIFGMRRDEFPGVSVSAAELSGMHEVGRCESKSSQFPDRTSERKVRIAREWCEKETRGNTPVTDRKMAIGKCGCRLMSDFLS